MSGKIKYAWYDTNSMMGCLTKTYKWGEFTSWATCDDEDVDIANQWDCYRLCDYKCEYMMLFQKARVLRERAHGMKIAYNNLSQKDDKLYHQYLVAEREADKVLMQAKRMRKNYKIFAEGVVTNRRSIRNSPRPTEVKDAQEKE